LALTCCIFSFGDSLIVKGKGLTISLENSMQRYIKNLQTQSNSAMSSAVGENPDKHTSSMPLPSSSSFSQIQMARTVLESTEVSHKLIAKHEQSLLSTNACPMLLLLHATAEPVHQEVLYLPHENEFLPKETSEPLHGGVKMVSFEGDDAERSSKCPASDLSRLIPNDVDLFSTSLSMCTHRHHDRDTEQLVRIAVDESDVTSDEVWSNFDHLHAAACECGQSLNDAEGTHRLENAQTHMLTPIDDLPFQERCCTPGTQASTDTAACSITPQRSSAPAPDSEALDPKIKAEPPDRFYACD